MESLQDIKLRLGAVRNVGKITRAMEVVAATKMRKAQDLAISSRPYALKALDLLQKLSDKAPLATSLQESRPARRTLVVIVASDKGLTGSFNAQVLRAADKFFESESRLRNQDHFFEIVAIGKKAELYAKKKKLPTIKSFFGAGDYAIPEDANEAANFVIDHFAGGLCDRVAVLSTHFRTALRQDVVLRQILPVEVSKIKETLDEILPERGRYSESLLSASDKLQTAQPTGRAGPQLVDYIFEPSPAETLNFLIPYLVRMQFYHLILEANASEHSARRVAMKNASDNADELATNLTLKYNTARQSGITKEIIEITSAKNALV